MLDYYTLNDWSLSGKSQFDTDAYNRFRDLIWDSFDGISDIYLQGSYRNSTGVYGHGDIDIVVECSGYYENAWYPHRDLNRLKYDLFNSLNGRYNFKFHLGGKTIKYDGSDKYSPADIVPCIPYRGKSITGISIYDHKWDMVIHNYPKQHAHNGEEKNKRTGSRFKPMVRVFKSARDELIDEGTIREGLAPSYFIECLLYNVPDALFTEDIQQSFYWILGWLLGCDYNLLSFRCQNGITPLFVGDNCWRVDHCIKFLKALNKM